MRPGARPKRPKAAVIALFCGALVAAVGCGPGAVDGTASGNVRGPHVSDEGHFRVTVTPELDPVPINRIHTWTVTVTDPGGNPVDGARVVLDGDMPEHQHGLPTVPRMTGRTGPGTYRIEGVKFSMPGYWVMKLYVWSQGVTDEVTLELTLG